MAHLPVIAERLLHRLGPLALAGAVCPTNAELALLIGCSEQNVKQNIRTLAKQGLIAITNTKATRSIRVGNHETQPRAFAAPQVDGAATSAARSVRRTCLKCRAPFQSEGRHNHICESCKGTVEWRLGDAV